MSETKPTSPEARRRAPRRQGHRAQLTIPAHAWEQANALAAEQNTTPNDVLAQLVVRGLDAVERERWVQRTAQARVDAYRARSLEDGDVGPLPPVQEAVDQALSLRRDLADAM